MSLQYVTIDAFTATRYAGNPVAIIHLPDPDPTAITQRQKQAIAKEFNLSEIVFLHLAKPTPTSVQFASEVIIDIFTSYAEVPFAGHPTVGTAFYILHILKLGVSALITKAGKIPISINEAGTGVSAEIPHNFHQHSKTYDDHVLKPKAVVSIVKGMSFIFVQLDDLEALATAHVHGNLNVDTYNPEILDDGWKVGLVGTMYLVAQGEEEDGRKKYRTRMFASREDPGTGSASSGLASWLALQEDKGKGEGPFKYAFTQGVEMGKKNEIFLEVERTKTGDAIKKVVLSGQGVKVMEGRLEL